jgi:hypothetical protein
MEINPILSPMDIKFNRNRDFKVSRDPKPEAVEADSVPSNTANAGPSIGSSLSQIDYSLEPPLDDKAQTTKGQVADAEPLNQEEHKPEKATPERKIKTRAEKSKPPRAAQKKQ